MRTTTRIINHPIFSLSDGKNIGTVKDVYFDETLQKISGLYLGSEGVFSRTNKIIKADYIKLLGVDVVFVAESDIVQEENATPERSSWVLRQHLQKRPVHSQSGTEIGQISDVMIDEQGAVMGFALANVTVSGHIAEHNAISRSILMNPGSETTPMQIDQIKAEQPSHQLRIS